MQTRTDGTHVILPAAVPIGRRPDCARLPVTMLRQSDGKVRRDGSSAANVQPEHPVAERGGVQGASELEARKRRRVVANSIVYSRIRKDERRCPQEQWKYDRLGGQDKSGSPAEPQAIDMAWVPACRSVVARAALFIFSSDFKGIFGTVWHLAFAEVPV
ncbi:hypothetical protein [Xanthobacter autotrophicus]|uniref:hypothetical protein n=1 Tax=Xanthobacter autotrophicus TaxID=280 RepID=UPI003727A943